jgi:hypothetical protein
LACVERAKDFLAARIVNCWRSTISAIYSNPHPTISSLHSALSGSLGAHLELCRTHIRTSTSHNAESICIAGADFRPQPELQAQDHKLQPPAAEICTQGASHYHALTVFRHGEINFCRRSSSLVLKDGQLSSRASTHSQRLYQQRWDPRAAMFSSSPATARPRSQRVRIGCPTSSEDVR